MAMAMVGSSKAKDGLTLLLTTMHTIVRRRGGEEGWRMGFFPGVNV